MRIRHGRITLELHELAHRQGPALLLLHALGGSSEDWGEVPALWPGPAFALDFCGHGRSDRLTGGGYYPELLVGDADAALAQIGRCAVAGAGLGAYVALLLAGARPELVSAALLLPGPGLAGGGALPDFTRMLPDVEAGGASSAHDLMMSALDRDVRPVDYAEAFAHTARRLLLMEDGETRPPWWDAVRRTPSAEVLRAPLGESLARLADTAQER